MSYSYDMYLADSADRHMGVNVDETSQEYREEVQRETCIGEMHECDNCEDCFACLRSCGCYNCIGAEDSEGCSNCTGAIDCIDCANCYKIYSCTNAYNCKDCEHCKDCKNCEDCKDCYNCHDLNDCKYCWGCSNLTGKRFMINNSYFGYITLERERFRNDKAWKEFQSIEDFVKYNSHMISVTGNKITITDSAGLYLKSVFTEIKIPEVGESFN